MNTIPIRNAADVPLTANPGTLPNVQGAMLNWFQPIQYIRLTQVVVNFEIYDLTTPYLFQGVLQPFTAQQLQMKPEGQRNWKWFTVHAFPTLELINNEIIWIENTKYRVMEKLDYAKYGYYEYHLCNDYQDETRQPVLPNENDLSTWTSTVTASDPGTLDVDVSGEIPDAEDALWGLYDIDNGRTPVIGAITVLNATTVRITFFSAGNFRLVGVY